MKKKIFKKNKQKKCVEDIDRERHQHILQLEKLDRERQALIIESEKQQSRKQSMENLKKRHNAIYLTDKPGSCRFLQFIFHMMKAMDPQKFIELNKHEFQVEGILDFFDEITKKEEE